MATLEMDPIAVNTGTQITECYYQYRLLDQFPIYSLNRFLLVFLYNYLPCRNNKESLLTLDGKFLYTFKGYFQKFFLLTFFLMNVQRKYLRLYLQRLCKSYSLIKKENYVLYIFFCAFLLFLLNTVHCP